MQNDVGCAKCEGMVKRAIPAIRFALSNLLHDDYGMNQTEISATLGITQASVNKYLNGKCAPGVLVAGRILMHNSTVAAATKRIASLGKKGAGPRETTDIIDKLAANDAVLGHLG